MTMQSAPYLAQRVLFVLDKTRAGQAVQIALINLDLKFDGDNKFDTATNLLENNRNSNTNNKTSAVLEAFMFDD